MLTGFGKVIAFVATASIGYFAATDASSDELTKWRVTHTPVKGDERWIEANSDSSHEWVVFLREGIISVRLRNPEHGKGKTFPHETCNASLMPFEIKKGTSAEGLAGDKVCAEVSDGWIVGFNAGEFGARLWWFSPDGTSRYRISDDHLIGLVRTRIGLVGIGGLAHGTTSEGRILSLSQNAKGIWEAKKVMTLKFAPSCYAKESSNSIIIITTNQLVRVQLDIGKLDVMIDDAFWEGLYPVSAVAAPSKAIYIGMRHGVAKVERRDDSYSVLWLTPP